MAGFLFLGTLKLHVRNRWLGKGAFMPSPQPQKLKRRATILFGALDQDGWASSTFAR
jgi:hypothetical protein